MASMDTAATALLRRTSVWSDELKTILMGELSAMRWVAQLPDFLGDTLNIPSIGEGNVRNITENQEVIFDAIGIGNYQFTITEYVSSAHYITKKARQDSFYAQRLEAALVPAQARAIAEKIETDIFAVVKNNSRGGQVLSDPNTINGLNHRWVGRGTTATISLQDFAKAKVALQKANVPLTNLVAVVDPSVGYSLETNTNLVNISNNPMWEGVITTGLMDSMQFSKNVYGFDVYVSNFLPTAVSETVAASTGSLSTNASGVNNIFFSAESSVIPFLYSWKQPPEVEGVVNVTKQREEYVTTARYGVQIFRPENLVSVLTNTDQV